MIKKVIEIDVDELQALGGLNNLNKAVQETDKQTASLKTQIREATMELIKAQEEFGDYSAAALDAAKKVALLKDKVQEAKETSDLYDPGKRFQVATNAIAAGANALQGYQAALGLVGVEGEGAQEALLKVQSAMALSQSLSVIADSGKEFRRLAAEAQKFTIVQKAITAGQWLWNAAQAANPIGAIVAAVVALIAAGVALTKYFMDNAEAAKINAAAVEKNKVALESQTKTLERNSEQFEKKQKQELAMAKASGASAEAIRKLELKLIDEKIAYEKSQRAIAENTYQKNLNTLASLKAAGADEEVIKKQQETANESIKQYNKQNQDVRKALDEKKDIQDRHLVEIKTAEVSSAKETAQKRKEQQDKARQELKDQQKKDLEEIKKIQQEAVKANDDVVLSEREKELNDNKIKNDAKLALLRKYGKDTNELEIQIANEKNDIENKYAEAERAKKKEKQEKDAKDKEEFLAQFREKEKEYADLQTEAEVEALRSKNEKLLEEQLAADLLKAEAMGATEEQLATIRNNYQLRKEESDTGAAEREKAIAKAKTDALFSIAESGVNMLDSLSKLGLIKGKAAQAAQKALTLAQIGRDTASAISSLVKGSDATGAAAGPAYLPVKIATFASGLVPILANVAKAKQLLSGSDSGGGGSVSVSAPSAGGAGISAAPSFNVVGNSGVNQIQQTLGMQQQQPIQAYVVANNVTTAQSLDRNIIRNASLG